jgi:hypothetical protein
MGIQFHLNEYRKDAHSRTDDGTKMYVKDIFISSSFET